MRFLAFLIAIVITASAQAAAITISVSVVLASADDHLNSTAGRAFRGTTIPTSTTLDAIDGAAYSKNVINWSVNGGQTILSFDVDHMRNGILESTIKTGLELFEFTANSNEPYEMSGYYNATDVGSSGSVLLGGGLYDLTSNATLFASEQISSNTTNVHFVFGGTAGESNFLQGSPTGNLIAGHVYGLGFNLRSQAYPTADSGASALGNFTLKIGTVNGDFNDDHSIDAADYVVLRKHNYSSSYYDLWRSQFGTTYSIGSGSSIESASVPEPSTLLLLAISAISLLGYRKSK